MIESKTLQQQLALILAALLIIVIVGTLVYSVWQWRSDWILVHKPLPTVAGVADDSNATLVANIPNYHLFGQSGDVPISNLQLQVTGIVKMSSDDNAISKAYISIAGERTKIYKIDDRLPSGVKVYDITSNAVILDNGGHLEKLPLSREPLQFKSREVVENE